MLVGVIDAVTLGVFDGVLVGVGDGQINPKVQTAQFSSPKLMFT